MNKRDELLSLYNHYLFFGLFFLAATPYTSYHVTSAYYFTVRGSIFTVYSWFFPINLMKTGIGQSKYCIPQSFSCCLICLCNSLFYFNSIFIFFDWSRSYFLTQRWSFTVFQWFFKPWITLFYCIKNLKSWLYIAYFWRNWSSCFCPKLRTGHFAQNLMVL